MNLGLKIIWASAKPSLAYLRLVAALRFHGVPLVVPVLPLVVPGSPKAARLAVLN